MPALKLAQPLVFQPIFMERVWGGRRLESLYGKHLPSGVRIGESWEIVDRPEAQSVVETGPLRGSTLHDLWANHRAEIFGDVPDHPRFPLLVKLLDAQDKLSLQVHPPPDAVRALGGESKSEFWYIADASPAAELFAGLAGASSRSAFESAIADGTVEQQVHRIKAAAGDAMFLPSGRLHAIGAGNVIVEIQQNSDTTYRVFDWNRRSSSGTQRELHVQESLRCIDFDDLRPELARPDGESLVREEFFNVDKWHLDGERKATLANSFAIFCCLIGPVECCGRAFQAGQFFLLPASLSGTTIRASGRSELLRITITT